MMKSSTGKYCARFMSSPCSRRSNCGIVAFRQARSPGKPGVETYSRSRISEDHGMPFKHLKMHVSSCRPKDGAGTPAQDEAGALCKKSLPRKCAAGFSTRWTLAVFQRETTVLQCAGILAIVTDGQQAGALGLAQLVQDLGAGQGLITGLRSGIAGLLAHDDQALGLGHAQRLDDIRTGLRAGRHDFRIVGLI